MGKATGFLEYSRVDAGYRPVSLRLADWEEILLPAGEQALREQAARCMDCGVPFCHAGFVVEGRSIGCPLRNLIPETNDLVYRGDDGAAFERLRKTNPFPEFTGRVCPALCEGSCTLGEHDQPVTVRDIERHIADAAFAAGGLAPRVPARRTGRRVAVVGSGPAGLACADLLNQLGETVVVYERANRPGGLLLYGIPNMKLDKRLVARRVALLEAEGVAFRCGAEVGRDIPVADLVQEYDALVLCTGATRQRTLSVPGSGLDGVHTAMEYLGAATQTLLGEAPAGAPDAAGRHVVVVGGGDTGTDCVATALRQGAASVVQLEIAPKPPESRGAHNPWPLWPGLLKTDYGHHEAIERLGADPRRWSTTVTAVKDDGRGRVGGVHTTRVNAAFQPIAGTDAALKADMVVTAMGFTGPEEGLVRSLGIAADRRGCIATAGDAYDTSLAGVFAAGDVHRGPSLVVWALYEGRGAALQCHNALAKQ